MQDLSSKLGGLSVTQMGKFLLHGKKILGRRWMTHVSFWRTH